MKTIYSAILSLILSTTVFAQSAANVPAPPPSKPPVPLSKTVLDHIAQMTPLFDGSTLDGWIQLPPYALSFSAEDIANLPSLLKKLSEKSDLVSAFVAGQMDDSTKAALASYSPAVTNTRAVRSAVTKAINKLVAGPSIFDESRFSGVHLRPETSDLLKQSPIGQSLARLNRMLFEDAYPDELVKSKAAAWIVKDGAMASTGAGRGVIYTKGDYTHFRLVFQMREISGNHQPCILIFCTRPPAGEKGLDALGGIQFQVPNGGHWDYRPGHNNGGTGFKNPIKTKYNNHEWSQVEILVNAQTGVARMAVAQPIGTTGVENLDFSDPEAGKTGPIALQMHNAGLFDEYKDLQIEIDPKEDRLITVAP